MSDNGSQFTSEEFAYFVKSNGIKHIRTAPYHPSSNGAVERLVQSFKRVIRATENEEKSLQRQLSTFLLNYRITPHTTTNVAPCELFLNRSVRTRLDLLKPDIKCNVGWKQAQQKSDHDGSKQERKLHIGQKVMVRNYRDGTKWMAGVVLQSCGPLSYLVETEGGQIWHRHIDHIRDNQLENTTTSLEYFILDDSYNIQIPNANTGQDSTDIQPSIIMYLHVVILDVIVNLQTIISNRLLNDCVHVFVVCIIYLHLYLSKCGGMYYI